MCVRPLVTSTEFQGKEDGTQRKIPKPTSSMGKMPDLLRSERFLPVQGGEVLSLFLGKRPCWDLALDSLQLG